MQCNASDFENFINNTEEYNKVIYALNNIPGTIYSLLLGDNVDVCQKYFQIYFKKGARKYQLTYNNLQNLDEYLDDGNIRYIYIRVALLDKNIHHVNCIIIDKLRRYILYFEPKVILKVDMEDIHDLFKYYNLLGYRYITPTDIGYNFINRLQYFDHFCQTYILFVFMIIIGCDNCINYKKFSKIFTDNITVETIGNFLFIIYQKMDMAGITIYNEQLSQYNSANGIYNFFNLFKTKQLFYEEHVKQNKINITCDDDYTLIF